MFNMFAHTPYMEYKETAEALQAHHPHLRPTSPKTVFAATTINMGPRSFSPPHVDDGNNAAGWCVATALGPFDADKGGHFVLWNLKIIVRFPPGASILFPSALVTHSNIPVQEHEKRYSIIQYSAGALFRWRYNGFKSDKAFLASATPEQLVKREQDRKVRWKRALEGFSRWEDVRTGNWKGSSMEQVRVRSESEDEVNVRPSKRVRSN